MSAIQMPEIRFLDRHIMRIIGRHGEDTERISVRMTAIVGIEAESSVRRAELIWCNHRFEDNVCEEVADDHDDTHRDGRLISSDTHKWHHEAAENHLEESQQGTRAAGIFSLA